jgi:hypothetical protein
MIWFLSASGTPVPIYKLILIISEYVQQVTIQNVGIEVSAIKTSHEAGFEQILIMKGSGQPILKWNENNGIMYG